MFTSQTLLGQSAADSYGMDVLIGCLNQGENKDECQKKSQKAIKSYQIAFPNMNQKKDAQPQKNTPNKTTFFYHLKGNDTFKVYDSAKGTVAVTELEADSYIPFKGISSERALIETEKGKNLYVEIKEQKTKYISTDSPIPVYIDRPKGEDITLFPKPGMTWRDCDNKHLPSECEGRLWPRSDPDTKLNIIDSKMVSIKDPLTGASEYKLFYQVNGSYKPKSNWKGERTIQGLWISADEIRNSPLGNSEVDIVSPQEEPCPPSNKTEVKKKSKDIIDAVKTVSHKLNDDFVNNLINHGYIGKCLNSRSNTLQSQKTNPFNSFMKPHWKKLNKEKDNMITFEGKKVTATQLFAIDSLARTVFTEMRGCVRKGLRYPMSVARVALNRAYFSRDFAIKNNGKVHQLSYVKDSSPGLDGKPFDYRKAPIEETLTRVLSASGQFSAWNSNDPNVKLALCPKNLRSQDQEAWQKSVQVAAHAILRRKDFKNITKNISMHHYSSNMTPQWASSKKLERNLEVGGLPLDSMKCIKLWSDNNSNHHEWKAANRLIDSYVFALRQ